MAKLPKPIFLPLLAELIPRGDGSFILKPRLPDPVGHTWLTILDTGAILHIPRHAVYPLLGDLLIYKQPQKQRYLVRLDSVQRLNDAIQDPEFWHTASLQKALRTWVAAQMQSLILAASKALAIL